MGLHMLQDVPALGVNLLMHSRLGLAWDTQLVDELPIEPHDVPLSAIVTPTRIYGPFA